MITKTVLVSQLISVTVDESKFTPEFLDEYRRVMHPLDTIEEHIANLAQLCARGFIDECGPAFIEGYGLMSEMGISFANLAGAQEIVES